MAAKNKFMNAMKMPAIADMFSSEADRQRESGDLVTEVPLSELHPFVNHPFEVRDDEDMQKLVDSIKENGVLTNLTVRPRAEGGYEIISGHRRFHAAQLAGLDKIKVQVRDVDDDQAIIDMVDANIQREHISPMEKARAYAMKLEAITKTIQRGKGKGKLKGFPLCGRCNIQRDCKVRPIQKYMKSLPQDTQQYVGLATDEQDRLMRLQEKQISLLEQYACSESEAWELCHRYGLLSPVYDFTDRNGCWFCPNAKLPELRHLYDHHPDLWREMLALQALPNKATEKFNRELRFSDYDILFHNEDAQLCWFTQ